MQRSWASTGGAQAGGASSGGTRASESGGRASGGQRPNIGVRTSTGGKAEPNTAGGCSVSAARAAGARDFGSLASAAALCLLARRRSLRKLRSTR
ncbi:MAG TPA: hypothetical protein VG937_01610 [Polyangiaceae bacterium]|nr:hypothetical protein [Polyangiaceae bacterium]